MKKILYHVLIFVAVSSLASCEAYFNDMEGDLTKMSAEDMLKSETGMKAILANLYGDIPMNAFSTGDQNTMLANDGRSSNSIGVNGVASFWDYKKIRSINKFLEALDSAMENGTISQSTHDTFRGEALFIRAYCYFASIRVYGGIPIVTESLDSYYDGQENEGLYFPRSTEKESWDWVLDELEEAVSLLPETQSQDMRANKYAALALRARVALWAASVSKYWDRAAINGSYTAVQKRLTYMESSYANNYYMEAIESAQQVINSGRYALAGARPSNVEEAKSNLINLFQSYDSTEGIFAKSYVSGSSTTSNGIEPQQGGGWFKSSVWQSGTYAITLNCADSFDNYDASGGRADGTISTRLDGNEDYYVITPESTFKYADVAAYRHYPEPSAPFKNKDARFQAWIVYPGAQFRGSAQNIQGGMIYPDKSVSIYPVTNDGFEFDGKIYYPFGGAVEDNLCFYKINFDKNNSTNSEYGFCIRKFLDPSGWNPYNQAPWYDIRYAEVLLTYAEAVAESGAGNKNLATQYLNDVRHRAGFKDDIELSVSNVLHEFKVEFAFENMWSQVLYRRRAFYSPESADNELEGTVGRKLALIPLADLSGNEASYIFVRATPYSSDPIRYTGTLRVSPEDYYASIPNYNNNRIENNNK